MKMHYKSKIELMYTDTDSLMYHIWTDDFYVDLSENPISLNQMDTANLLRDHPCHIAKRKKIPRLFSDETYCPTITEFVALRAKSYMYSVEGMEKIKAKGIKGHLVRNMTLKDHKRCIFDDQTLQRYTENMSIQSYNNQLAIICSKKLTYNSHDDKRFVLYDKIHTLMHEHYKIEEILASDPIYQLGPEDMEWD